MGYSMRTDTHRYVQWMVWDGAKLLPDWSKVVGRELYDHDQDPLENVNLAPKLGPHNPLVTKLSALLKQHPTA